MLFKRPNGFFFSFFFFCFIFFFSQHRVSRMSLNYMNAFSVLFFVFFVPSNLSSRSILTSLSVAEKDIATFPRVFYVALDGEVCKNIFFCGTRFALI